MSEKVQKAEPRLLRLAALWLVISSVIGSLLIVWFMDWQQELNLLTKSDPQKAGESMARFLRGFAVLNALVLSGLALWIGRFSRKISGSGRYPPAGISVTKDTEIITGCKAKKYAIAGYLLALLFLILGVLLIIISENIRNLLLA